MLSKANVVVATALLLRAETGQAVYAEQPTTRFTKWSTLSADHFDAATSIGYDEESWGFLTGIDLISFSENTALVNGFTAAMETMGIEEDPWDCWVSHFETYDWEEMVAVDIEFGSSLISSFEALGWSQDAWNGNVDPPASNDLFFAELSANEQAAATYLCYTETLWNGEESINDFGTEGPGRSPEEEETERPSESPVRAPTGSPVRRPTQSPVRRPTWQPSLSPTSAPFTRKPSSSPVRVPEPSPTRVETGSPVALPSTPSPVLTTRSPTASPTLSPETSSSMNSPFSTVRPTTARFVLINKLLSGPTAPTSTPAPETPIPSSEPVDATGTPSLSPISQTSGIARCIPARIVSLITTAAVLYIL